MRLRLGQVVQLDQKWEALEGLQREAQKQAAAVAKLEADLARMQGELDALPAPLPSGEQAAQQSTPDILALRKEINDMNAKVIAHLMGLHTPASILQI